MAVIRPADDSGGTVVVTGAASGIGAATARLAAARGDAVALLDRDGAAVEAAAHELRDAGAKALGLACDVAGEREVDDAFAAAVAQLGPLRGVVASAGIDRGGLLHELDAAAWDELIAVNLRGTFLTCRAALRRLLDAGGGGSIVCVSSPFALVAAPGGTGAYSASKGGVCALVRSLAVDYGPHGIRVNAILPGPTETPLMWANVSADEVAATRETVKHEVPLGRLAGAEEPAKAALWLLSDEAAYVTGAQLACDGGVLAKASISV
ncbi:MAG TPA: SDR family NAD(P)-dependent oxidoreductase [Conexibacter sp.]